MKVLDNQNCLLKSKPRFRLMIIQMSNRYVVAIASYMILMISILEVAEFGGNFGDLSINGYKRATLGMYLEKNTLGGTRTYSWR